MNAPLTGNASTCNLMEYVFRPYLKTSLKLGHGGLENQNVDIENTSCLSMTSSNVSLPVCRICQLPGVEPSNPLISPCRCLGSIRYVHNNCLLVSTYLFHHLVYQDFWKLSNFISLAFHPIFVTSFLVVFGEKVTKILRNSLFTFFTGQGKTGKTKI